MAAIPDKQRVWVERVYVDRGWSAREIAEHLHVGIGAVYYLMRKHRMKRRTRSEQNYVRFERKPLSFSVSKNLSREQRRLRDVGCALYWAEGAKTGHTVDFANCDVLMCKLFLQFLRVICRIDESRLRGYIYCHENQRPTSMVNFWSHTLGIPRSQFSKPYVRRYGQGYQARRLPKRMEHGLVHVRYSDLKLLRQIFSWIEELKNEGR